MAKIKRVLQYLDFKPIKGNKARRYYSSQLNQEISVRQFQTLAKVPDAFVRAYAQKYKLTEDQTKADIGFRLDYLTHIKIAKRKKPDTRPGHEWANVLEDIGIRDEGATYDVGDTP